ncbi:SH3 domain-containing protein [Spirochaeta isovalerica]|uniref:SH3b domain-containing protein n=1 Tax=Spirochaeta isovalerica TaxID=150 RepID=A0A841RGL1_9SPIO|nr:SH3 domain-containing protein [Spirochaeta isovalerica]MBB6482706.1 hypothetical protein [Spirochaeta isovalerica]
MKYNNVLLSSVILFLILSGVFSQDFNLSEYSKSVLLLSDNCSVIDYRKILQNSENEYSFDDLNYLEIDINGTKLISEYGSLGRQYTDVFLEDLNNDSFPEVFVKFKTMIGFYAGKRESLSIYELKNSTIEYIGFIELARSEDDGDRFYQYLDNQQYFKNNYRIIKTVSKDSKPPYNADPFIFYYFDELSQRYIKEESANHQSFLSQFKREYETGKKHFETDNLYFINDNHINVRNAIGLDSQVLFQVNNLDKVYLLDRSYIVYSVNNLSENYWYKIKTLDGKEGWMFGEYLLLND